MQAPILVVNAGSSSIKFSVFATAGTETLAARVHGQVDHIGGAARLAASDQGGRPLADEPVAGGDHRAAIAAIHAWLGRHSGGEAGFAAVGHRVVHGGGEFAAPTLIDDRVLAALEALVPLAPLHQPDRKSTRLNSSHVSI